MTNAFDISSSVFSSNCHNIFAYAMFELVFTWHCALFLPLIWYADDVNIENQEVRQAVHQI